MKRSNRLILLIGVFLAIVAFVGLILILNGQNGSSGQPPEPTTSNTVIAAVDIPFGTQITEEMLTEEVLQLDARNAGAFADPGQVIGRTVTRSIATGAQITEQDFSINTTTDLEVPATNRAIAVQVDQVTGVGTLIKPGDRVDMVVGFTGERFPVISVDPDSAEGTGVTVVSGLNSTSVKLLLQGMQVLGTLLPPPTTVEGQPPAEGGETPATLTGQQEIVILSVNAQQAEIIKFAQMDGSISLVLRSTEDFVDDNGNPIEPPPSETTGATLKVLVDEYGVLVPQLVETLLPAVGR